MTEDRTAGRELFISQAIALVERPRNLDHGTAGKTWTRWRDTVLYVKVTNVEDGYTLCAWNAIGYRATVSYVQWRGDFWEQLAGTLWDDLETQYARHNPQAVVRQVCDGGNLPCKAVAAWAYRGSPEDEWMYACDCHLTWSMTAELGGEQGELTVRRIVTDGC